MIVDAKICVTGSFNYSNCATMCNYENTVTIRFQALAEAYIAEFAQMERRAEKVHGLRRAGVRMHAMADQFYASQGGFVC